MITTAPYLTRDAYLADEDETDTHSELEAGTLAPMPSEPRMNDCMAMVILSALLALLPPARLSCKGTEIAVTGLRTTVRLPERMVLSKALVPRLENQSWAIIRPDMPPPQWVVEVVAPGKRSADRDYRYKRSASAARGIPEYWLVDPMRAQVLVLTLVDGLYEEAVYQRGDRVQSPTLPTLSLTVDGIFAGCPLWMITP